MKEIRAISAAQTIKHKTQPYNQLITGSGNFIQKPSDNWNFQPHPDLAPQPLVFHNVEYYTQHKNMEEKKSVNAKAGKKIKYEKD